MLHTIGAPRAGEAQLKPGDTILPDALIRTGRRDVAAIQLRTEQGQVTMLLRGNTTLRMGAWQLGENRTITPYLERGTILVSAADLPQSSTLRIRTDSASVRVTGTRLRVATGTNRVDVTVHEGEVTVRPRLAELEDLSEETLAASPEFAATQEALRKLGAPVKAGERLRLETSALRESLSPELKQALEAARSNPDAAGLDRALRESKLAGAIQSSAGGGKLLVELRRDSLSGAALRGENKTYEQIRGLTPEELREDPEKLREILRERNSAPDMSKLRLREFERAYTDQSLSILTLKNNVKLRGVILGQEGPNLILMTPEGRRKIPNTQIVSVAYP